MEKIKTSHLIYFFVLLFPLTNFVLPFFFYGDEMSIRIYVEGTFTDVPSAENNVFPDDGVYSIGKHQGYEHKIDPKSIYISMLYILIFFFTIFFTFSFKNKNLSFEIEFFKNNKKQYLLLIFFFFIFIFSIKYFELKNVSNLFDNLLILSKIFLLFFSCLLIFISRDKKELFFFVFLLFVIFLYIIDLRSNINLPITYNLIFYSYFLSFILCIFLALKNKLKFMNLIALGVAGIFLISVSFLWKENLRSYSNYNWSKLSKKIDIGNINKPFGSNNILLSTLSAPIARINKLDQLSYIVEKKDHIDPLWGESYVPLFTKFIPRKLWRDKPQEVFGNRYGREYKLIPSYDISTSVGASTLVEAYINFKFLGIIFLAIFYGLIYRVLNYYIYINRKKNNYLSFLLVTICIFISITSESNLSSGLGGALQMIFIAIIYYFFFKVWKNRIKEYET